jgi:calcineurin-like phosphoesterase family protein
MERFFATSDCHFSHANISRYCNRPFDSVHDMNEHLTEIWNKTVKKNDRIAILGDLTMNPKKVPEFLLKLNGRKIYIPGNHDKKAEKYIRRWEEENNKKLVEEYSPLLTRNVGGHIIVMCHYAMRVWDRSHHNSIQLFGHSHSGLLPIGRQLDVGVDNAKKLLGEYRPFSLQEILMFIPDSSSNKYH